MSEQHTNQFERLCKEKHDNLKEYHARQERRINNHSERIDKIEQALAGSTVEIRELCKRIDSLVKSNERIMDSFKKGTGIVIATLLGFFVWYVQRL